MILDKLILILFHERLGLQLQIIVDQSFNMVTIH